MVGNTEKNDKKRITCCRQSWDSAEMHPHLLPLHCDKNIEIKKGFNLTKCKPSTYVRASGKRLMFKQTGHQVPEKRRTPLCNNTLHFGGLTKNI